MNGKMMRTVSLALVMALGMAVGVADADFVFGPAVNMGPTINTSQRDSSPTIMPDDLTLWFSRRPTLDDTAIWWLTTRATTDDPWGAPVEHGPWSDDDWNVIDIHQGYTTPDGLELYTSDRDRAGGYGSLDLWMMQRQSRSDPWGPATNLGPVINTEFEEMWPVLSPDGLEMYFSGFSRDLARPGGYGHSDIWVTKRESIGAPWSEPVNLGSGINSSAQDARPNISADGLMLFFDSQRAGGEGAADLYMVSRNTLSDPWGEAENLGPLINSPAWDSPVDLSDDCRTLYFASPRSGGYGNYDIYQVSITPLVDLNGDGNVDAKDAVLMTDNWGTDDPVCDIGPMPWGDGVVDVEDLIILSEHFFEDVNDPTLVAHWALDEIEGIRTRESVGGGDSYALGDPIWEPAGGQVGGALQMDGVDDWVATGFVLDPSEGPFSVLAWIKGGGPGQLIVSQVGGTGCLMLDEEGRLMTELASPGRESSPLQSETAIDDGQWHRVGLIWDGLNRTLVVDDVVVAEDTQNSLGGSGIELCIGLGKASRPGTSFSGLIDDVRIYSRAVKP